MDGVARRLFLCSLAIATVVYVANVGGRVAAFLYVAIEVVAIVALWCAVLSRRSPLSHAWSWLTAGFTLWVSADSYLTIVSLNADEPWMSVADIGYVAGSMLLLVGVVSMSSGHRLGRDLDGWIDAGAVLTAALLVMWQLVVSPMLDSPGMPTLARWLAAFYAVIDVALLVLVVRLWLSRAKRTAALGWLLAAVALVTAADVVYSVVAQAGLYTGTAAAMLDV